MLEMADVSKVYKTGMFGMNATPAVTRASLRLGRGEIVGLAGESGCGKSTLARLALKLIPPTCGKILIDGADVTGLSERAFRPYRRRLQIIFQHPESAFDPCYTLRASIDEAFARAAIPREERARHLRHVAGLVNLPPGILDRYPGQVSGGEIQRAALARVLSLRPEYLILDEPTSMLDVSTQAHIMQTIKAVRRAENTGILLISHDPELIRAVCGRLYIMNKGAIVDSGSVEDIFSHPRHPYTRQFIEGDLS